MYEEEVSKKREADKEVLLLGKAKLGKLPKGEKLDVLARNGLISEAKREKMRAKLPSAQKKGGK